jgi:hypothetical protein
MFDNYKQMTDAEKASVKAIHKALRAETAGRAGNLAWGFVRGFPYRRIERTTRTQTMPDGSVVEHNRPDARYLTHLLGKLIPGFAEINEKQSWNTKPSPAIEAWLADPAGAIPVPVRVKLTSEEARARHESRKVA